MGRTAIPTIALENSNLRWQRFRGFLPLPWDYKSEAD